MRYLKIIFISNLWNNKSHKWFYFIWLTMEIFFESILGTNGNWIKNEKILEYKELKFAMIEKNPIYLQIGMVMILMIFLIFYR